MPTEAELDAYLAEAKTPEVIAENAEMDAALACLELYGVPE